MDLAAGVVLTVEVIRVCRDYPSGSADRLKILNALEDLKLVFERLQNLATDGGKPAQLRMIKQMCEANGPVVRCREALTLLKTKLTPPTNAFSKIKQTVMWPLEKKEANEARTYLQEAKSTFQLALAEDQIDLIADLQDDLFAFQKWMKNEVIAPLGMIRQDVDDIKTDALRQRIHTWLDPPIDYRSNYERHMKERQENTGRWFIDGDKFREWKSTTDRFGFFWLRGGMGMGKSVLCSAIIENVEFLCNQDPSKIIAYFYFDFRNPRKQLLIDLLKSLVSQLSNRSTDALRIVQSLYSKHQDGRSRPSLDAIADALHDILAVGQQTHIIIDALDECSERTKELLPWLEKLATSALPNVHVLCTSRREQDLEDSLESLATTVVDFDKGLVNDDVRIYLKSQLQSDKRLRKWPPEVQENIESELMAGAQGMFRWAACQVDVLRKCLTLPALRGKLRSLPSTLNETYSRILLGISVEYREYAQKILLWLAFSARGLSLDELVEALAIDLSSDDNPCFNPEMKIPDPQDVFTICSSLIYTEKGTVNLAHFSVKEYLMSCEVNKGDTQQFYLEKKVAEEFIARSCIVYLLQFDEDGLPEEIDRGSSFAKYAARYWIQHAQPASGIVSIRLERLLWTLFQPSSKAFYNWIRLHDIDDPLRMHIFSQPFETIPDRLYYSSKAGFTVIVNLLLEGGADVNAEGGHCGTTLQAASCGGHVEIVRLLIENGAKVNCEGGYFRNALYAASFEGYVDVVRLLMEKGAEVNAQGGAFGNALQAASYRGHVEIVRLLIEKGADVDAQGGDYGSALQAASFIGHVEIVWLLIEKGADMNAQEGYYGNVLQVASCIGHVEIVRLLIDKGADVNAQGGSYENALQAASFRGHVDIIHLLIKKGAEVNAQGAQYGNALQAASYGGHVDVVCLLIEKAAEVNAQGGDYANALYAASYGGHVGIVRLLIEKGAEVNAKGGRYGNALQAASCEGHLEIVWLLIEKGAEVNAQGGYFGNALQAASIGGHLDIVGLLIEKGAEVSAQGGNFGNALQAASHGGHVEMVHLLIEKGVKVSAQGGGALQAASYRGHVEIVRLLIEKGAEVNAQGGDFGNALYAASYGGYVEIVRLLIEKGAEVSAQGGYFGDALQAASYRGHVDVVRLLINKGAYVNAQGGYYGSALPAASFRGHVEIVRLLIEKGAVPQYS